MLTTIRSLFLSVVLAVLAGCSALQFAEPYNPTIESGLDEYSKALTVFLKTQEQDGASPATLYNSEESRDFYRQSEATLSNIVLQAEAGTNQRQCLPQLAAKLGVDTLLMNSSGLAQLQENAAGDQRLAVALQDGSCTVVVLKAVRANNRILEAMHRKNGRLAPGAAALARSLLEDSIRMALRIEKAKKG